MTVGTELQYSKSPSHAAKAEVSASGALPSNWLESGVALLDKAGRITEVDEALANWLGRARSELTGLSFWELLAELLPESEAAIREAGRGMAAFSRFALKSGNTSGTGQQSLALEVAQNGSGAFVRLNSALPPLSELEEAVWDEHLQSESQRREMFMRLLRAEAQLDRLMRRWPCVVFSQRPDFSLHYTTPNIQELTGVPATDWASQPRRFWELVHENDAVELGQQFKRAVQSGEHVTNTYRIRHAQTGRVAYILEHRQPVISQSGLLLGYEVAWLDVTRQTVAENRLSSAAWKETLAVLTLGLAHDFRNMMAGIHSLSESYVSQIEKEHPFHEGLTLIQKNSSQANQLVQRMISLHLGQTGERAYHDLNEITRDITDLVMKILSRKIKLGMELAEGPLPVFADVVELRQVVINLLLNAADAMPKGGNLTLVTSRQTKFPKLENMKGHAPRLPCVCLAIRDDGTGIKARHLAAIFDPFFTTKAKGSGLGLYNARIAMEKHRGAISVESVEGAGATFCLWLPEADLSAPAPEMNDTETAILERRTLLLAGQSGEVLDRTAELLRSNNYHVVLATGPESLPELLQSSDYEFAGAMVLAEPPLRGVSPFLLEIRAQAAELKVALKLAGGHPDDLPPEIVKAADLLLNFEAPEADMLQKLEAFLKPKA